MRTLLAATLTVAAAALTVAAAALTVSTTTVAAAALTVAAAALTARGDARVQLCPSWHHRGHFSSSLERRACSALRRHCGFPRRFQLRLQ